MSWQRIASSAAHTVASEVAREYTVPPEYEVTGTARIEIDGVRVLVVIVRDDTRPADETKEKPHLTPLQIRILDNAPSRLGTPVSMMRLARLSNASYNSWFRKSVGALVTWGLLVKLPTGFRKP